MIGYGQGQIGYGHNDENGVVYCHFCDWSKNCGSNMELIEASLKKHLEEVHGKPLLYRTEDESGKRTDIPQ
jgi:hypothetical protein